ncbi:MAG: methyl-accepting chemotaxis protein [Clostridium sp.]
MSVNFDFATADSMKTHISKRILGIFSLTSALNLLVNYFYVKKLISDVQAEGSLGMININDYALKYIIFATITTFVLVIIGTAFCYRLLCPMARLLNNFRIHIEFLVEGQFFYRVKKKHFARKDELGAIIRATDDMQISIMSMVTDVKDCATVMNDQSINLTNVSSEMKDLTESISTSISNITNEIASETSDIMQIVNELSDFSKQLNNNVNEVNELTSMANTVDSKANDSFKEMESLNQSFNEVNSIFVESVNILTTMKTNIEKVNEITELINNVAEQTNLLALNAAIEASRAGEAGRGFTVLSTEIRNLSVQTKESSVNINNLLNAVLTSSNNLVYKTTQMSDKLGQQKQTLNNSINSFTEISSSVTKMTPKIDKLGKSSIDMLSDNNNILHKMEDISSVASEMSHLSETINLSTRNLINSSETVLDSAKDLNNLADKTIGAISIFKLQDENGVENRNENIK